MRVVDERVVLRSAKDRVEIYVFGDCHIGKTNCAERAIRAQVAEILQQAREKDRQVRVLFGGDIMNQIVPQDVRRFDFHDLAPWLTEGNHRQICEHLGDIPEQELARAVDIFKPIAQHTLGAISGNHEDYIRRHFSYDIHERFCDRMEIPNLSDEAVIRLRFRSKTDDGHRRSSIMVYIRHGYGGGRSAGAEPNKLHNMLAEWDTMDVCFTGHSHTFCEAPPKLSLRLPVGRGNVPQLEQHYRYAANWGCWLYSHDVGPGTYESKQCYPGRALVTVKAVIWPFYRHRQNVQGKKMDHVVPKIELRKYAIL